MPSRQPRHRSLAPVAALAAVALGACADATPPLAPPSSAAPTYAKSTAPSRPTGKGIGTITTKANRTTQPMEHHGGDVMANGANVYFIWYGNWAGMTARQQILTDFVSSLGGSSYWQVLTSYRNVTGAPLANRIQYGGAATDAYTYGTSLAEYHVAFIVGEAIINGSLPPDPEGIYVVFTSADVDIPSGFGTAYCGFHSTTGVNGSTMKTVLVGSADRAPTTCQPQAIGPNGDAAADAMASVLAGELANTVTDPDFRAWYDKFNLEAGDKCAWSYGTTYTTPTGARANVHLGSRDYLLQQLWANSGRGLCTMQL